MVCSISCSISAIFIIAMIYFYNSTSNNEVVIHYKSKLPSDLQVLYDKISKERTPNINKITNFINYKNETFYHCCFCSNASTGLLK